MDIRGVKQKQVFRVVEQLYMGVQLLNRLFQKAYGWLFPESWGH